jgi:1,4-alpha-glucan branching enzyme
LVGSSGRRSELALGYGRGPSVAIGQSMSIDDLWYKSAILYCLDVEKYQDANGDGVGDFEGLMRRLDYLQGLGVTCVWLQPFYPSPNRDNGYDVVDFYNVHNKHGRWAISSSS